VREIGPFVLLLCACGAAVRQSSPNANARAPARAPEAETAEGPAASADSAEATAAFEAMAAQGGAIAPGMREVARKESGGDPVELVRADARDLCVRVAYEASGPIVAKLVERSGGVLAAAEVPATSGVLGARGPVCVRRGDVVRAVADGAGARVRWMAWEAP
jgi:hypothetical protein